MARPAQNMPENRIEGVFGRTKPDTTRRRIEQPATKNVFTDFYDLPSGYNTTKLTLIARDPNFVHAYWEIKPPTAGTLKKNIPESGENAATVIRVYDVTMKDFDGMNANHWFDVDVGPSAKSWYFPLWNDNVSYCAELGLRAPDGAFNSLARSNFVQTPRKTFSTRPETVWMEVKDDPRHASAYVVGSMRRVSNRTGPRRSVDRRASGRLRKFYLNDDDIRLYYSRLSPLLKDLISQRIEEEYYRAHGKIKDVSFLVSLSESRRFMIEDLISRGYFQRVFFGGAEEIKFVGSSESMPGGASDRIYKNREKTG